MKYLTHDGTTLNLSPGDHVYVDEGDSIGLIEFTGEVIEVNPDYFLAKPNAPEGTPHRNTVTRRVRPDWVADVQLLGRNTK